MRRKDFKYNKTGSGQGCSLNVLPVFENLGNFYYKQEPPSNVSFDGGCVCIFIRFLIYDKRISARIRADENNLGL